MSEFKIYLELNVSPSGQIFMVFTEGFVLLMRGLYAGEKGIGGQTGLSWEGRDSISFPNVAVKMVQCFLISHGSCHMWVDFREDSFQICMVKVSSYDKNPIRMSSL